jgi:hypothetical protein
LTAFPVNDVSNGTIATFVPGRSLARAGIEAFGFLWRLFIRGVRLHGFLALGSAATGEKNDED